MKEFENMYKEIFKDIFLYILKLSGDKGIAEDITQESFLRAYEYMLNGGIIKRAWIYAVARNLFIDRYRKLNKEMPKENFNDELLNYENPADIYYAKERELTLRRCIFKLPKDYRDTLVLKEYKGLSYAEISRALGISIDNVKIRLFRGRQKLRELYLKESGEFNE